MYSFSYLEPVCCSMSSSNCCFLTCIQISQEASQVVWYSHISQNFPQFIVIHTVTYCKHVISFYNCFSSVTPSCLTLYNLMDCSTPGFPVSHSVQFSSVQLLSRVQLCDPMNRSTPGLPVHHQLPEFTQTHVHRVGDAIQPSHPLLSPSPSAPNPSQHQSLFQ